MSATPDSWWKAWRQGLKRRMPFVRRRLLSRQQERNEELLALFAGATAASRAEARVVKPCGALGAEGCILVTYAPQPRLKNHVVRHVEALRAAGVEVVLVVNTPFPAEAFAFEARFVDGLGGLLVRENSGFDFGGWAHAYALFEPALCACSRVILTNDSIVGPLAPEGLPALLARLRASRADVAGLTDNHAFRHHLQSYFLALQGRALAPHALPSFMAGVLNLPTKELVILAYETRLTARLQSAGCSVEALFPSPAGRMDSPDTWAELARRGLPYLKTDVLEANWDAPAIRALVPHDILTAYEFANRR